MTSDDLRRFSTTLSTYLYQQFIHYNVRFSGLIWTPLPTLKSDVINGRSLMKSILGSANATVIHICRLCVFFVHKESSTQLSFLKRSIEVVRLAESYFPKSAELLTCLATKGIQHSNPLH